jgi:hypothetical protein
MTGIKVFRDSFVDKVVWKSRLFSLTIGAAATTAAVSVLGNARVGQINVAIPNWTNTVSATLTIVDSDAFTVYTSNAMTQNTSHHIVDMQNQILIYGSTTWTFTLSGVPGGAGGNLTFNAYFL